MRKYAERLKNLWNYKTRVSGMIAVISPRKNAFAEFDWKPKDLQIPSATHPTEGKKEDDRKNL
jgi:outer membrane biogenesis lipoprotein LolB